MDKIKLFTPINYQRECSFSEKTLSLLTNYFYLGGHKAFVVQKDMYNLESGDLSIGMKVAKIASYFLFLPVTLILLGAVYSLRAKHEFTLKQIEPSLPPPFEAFSMDVIDSSGVLRSIGIDTADRARTIIYDLDAIIEDIPVFIKKSGNKVEEIIEKLRKKGIQIVLKDDFYCCKKNKEVRGVDESVVIMVSRAQYEDILKSIEQNRIETIEQDESELPIGKFQIEGETIYRVTTDCMLIQSELSIGATDEPIYLMEVEREGNEIIALKRVESKGDLLNNIHNYIKVNKTPEEALVEIVMKSTCLPKLKEALSKIDRAKFIAAFCAERKGNSQSTIDPQIHQILSDNLRQELSKNVEAAPYFLPQQTF